MKWLITYRLFINNNFGTRCTRTDIVDTEPAIWWHRKLWREKENDWDGCTMLMVHELRASELAVI